MAFRTPGSTIIELKPIMNLALESNLDHCDAL